MLAIAQLMNVGALSDLAVEATADGHRMVARLIDEWGTGENRFDKPGERCYLATLDGHVCGTCGLNVDPFAGDDRVGRVRRLYVSVAARRRGIGTALMRQLMHDAADRFAELRLRTRDPRAAVFYEAIGFEAFTSMEHCTHRRLARA